MNSSILTPVTVVIPAYRAERFIARAIHSVLQQPGIDPEIIVIVDGVFDRTHEIARTFSKTRVLTNKFNEGAPAARNRGLAEAGAPYVMFLDSDDWVEGELLLGLAESLTADNGDVAFGPLIVAHCDGRRKYVQCFNGKPTKPAEYLQRLIHGSFVPPCATMWRTSFLRANGGWREGLRRYQDYELVLRSVIMQARPVVSDRGVGVSFQHSSDDRISSNTSREASIDRLNVLRETVALARANNLWSEALGGAFERAAYRLVRDFARHADGDVFAQAERFWRTLGGTQHQGSLAHQLSSRLLGIRRKEHFATRLARLRNRLTAARSLIT